MSNKYKKKPLSYFLVFFQGKRKIQGMMMGNMVVQVEGVFPNYMQTIRVIKEKHQFQICDITNIVPLTKAQYLEWVQVIEQPKNEIITD